MADRLIPPSNIGVGARISRFRPIWHELAIFANKIDRKGKAQLVRSDKMNTALDCLWNDKILLIKWHVGIFCWCPE
ncbi:hypothetical protein ASD92_01860 [Massilia sp. Root1485]|nr:hypothetical protein ASD92_01860 [Massilia sp. Root1485]